jgi:hypothetical protein
VFVAVATRPGAIGYDPCRDQETKLMLGLQTFAGWINHAYPVACQKINKEGKKAGRMWLHVSFPAFLPSLLKFF